MVLQALQKAGLGADKVHDYILVEEVARSWEKKGKDEPAAQRVLDVAERPLQAQAAWQGEGRFLLKRIGDDPSSRAWLSSIRSTESARRAGQQGNAAESKAENKTWDEEDNFMVCVYNVSPEIPYAILKAPRSACAQDVLAQALVKARRLEDPARFVLMEELEWGVAGAAGGAATKQNRVLADEENVYRTQAHWETMGRFILRERDEVTPQASRRHRVGHNLRTATQNMVRKVLDEARSTAAGVGAAKEKTPVQEALSDPTARQGLGQGGARGGSGGAGSAGVSRASSLAQRGREVHSEGETLSDDDGRDGDLRSAVSNLKKMSLKKLRVWKS